MKRRATQWYQTRRGNAHVSDGSMGFWATFPKGTTAKTVLDDYMSTADYTAATAAFTVEAEIDGHIASVRVGPGGAVRRDPSWRRAKKARRRDPERVPFLAFARASRRVADDRGIPVPSLADLRALYQSDASEGWRQASLAWLRANAALRSGRQSGRSPYPHRSDPRRSRRPPSPYHLRKRLPVSARLVDRRRGAYAIAKYGVDVKYLRARSEAEAIARYQANPHLADEWG